MAWHLRISTYRNPMHAMLWHSGKYTTALAACIDCMRPRLHATNVTLSSHSLGSKGYADALPSPDENSLRRKGGARD